MCVHVTSHGLVSIVLRDMTALYVAIAAGISQILNQLHKFFDDNQDFELDISKLKA